MISKNPGFGVDINAVEDLVGRDIGSNNNSLHDGDRKEVAITNAAFLETNPSTYRTIHLMRYLLLLTSFTLLLFSCRKETVKQLTPIEGNIAGHWRMVSVKDKDTKKTTVKPGSINRDVDITIALTNATNGVIEGVTPSNILTAKFQIGANQSLSILSMAMTEVMETGWGSLFVNNITHAQDYIFYAEDELNINTSTNKTLIFIRQ